MIVDDTGASFINVNLLSAADVVCSSLTKFFSGAGDVAGGSLVVNPRSPFHAEISARLREDGIPFKAGLLHFVLGETDEAFGAMRLDWPLPWDEALYLYVHRERPLTGVRGTPRFARLVDDVVQSWRAKVV